MTRRVVVTGLGLVTPLACGVEATWQKLLASKSGLRAIQGFDVSDLPARIAGQIQRGEGEGEFFADKWVAPKEQKKMDDFIIYAISAATQAIRDFGWKPEWEKTNSAPCGI